MAEFLLKYNYFEFNGQVKQQISGTVIGTKFTSAYACIFMDDIGSKFLETQSLQSGLDILIMCSLFGRMGKKSFSYFLPT